MKSGTLLLGGATAMPKTQGSKVKGVYERPKGSNNWSVRYKVGMRTNALLLFDYMLILMT